MKRNAKEAASRKTAGQKIVNALKPFKAVKEALKVAPKKPAKQLVKEALKVAPKTAIPVGIRETTREMYNEDAIPFATKPNNLSHNTLVLPDNVDSGPSITQKHLQLLAALYPQYYQKVA